MIPFSQFKNLHNFAPYEACFFFLAISVNLRILPFKVSCFWRALPSSGRNCILPLLAHNGWGNFYTFLGNIYCPFYMYSKYVAENSLQLRVSEKRKVRGRTYSNRKQMNIITIYVPLIFKMQDFCVAKLLYGRFQEIFWGDQDFFDPLIVQSAASDNFGHESISYVIQGKGT